MKIYFFASFDLLDFFINHVDLEISPSLLFPKQINEKKNMRIRTSSLGRHFSGIIHEIYYKSNLINNFIMLIYMLTMPWLISPFCDSVSQLFAVCVRSSQFLMLPWSITIKNHENWRHRHEYEREWEWNWEHYEELWENVSSWNHTHRIYYLSLKYKKKLYIIAVDNWKMSFFLYLTLMLWN
jgi:hypothetical protein